MLSGVGLLVALAASSSAQAVTVESEEKVTASDGVAGDQFAWSVAVSGDRVVVGAPSDDDLGPESGSVYVLEPDGAGGWSEAKLTASDGASGDRFGASVAVSGDRVVVGAQLDDDLGSESGSVYVFEPDGAGGWSETKLTASDGASGDRFGLSVAVAGDRVVVGAPFDDDQGSESGSGYVFEPDGAGGWSETKLTASDGAANDFFGDAVAASGDRVVVGAQIDDDLGFDSGSVYVFEPDGAAGWSETKLTASDGAAYDQFGASVAVSGDRVVVGAPFDDDLGFSSGSGYVFEPDGAGGWSETKLTASDGAELDFFAYSVAVSGDRVVAGAVADDDLGSDSGAGYVFEPDGAGGWSETKLTASDGAAFDFFGFSLAVSGDRVVVGARGDDDLGSTSGSAYVFGLTPVDADGDGIADADDICAGTDLTGPAPAELKKNRYWTTAEGGFVDATGKLSPYTIADTAGCSASQIVEAAALGAAHLRFGITASALAAWVAAH